MTTPATPAQNGSNPLIKQIALRGLEIFDADELIDKGDHGISPTFWHCAELALEEILVGNKLPSLDRKKRLLALLSELMERYESPDGALYDGLNSIYYPDAEASWDWLLARLAHKAVVEQLKQCASHKQRQENAWRYYQNDGETETEFALYIANRRAAEGWEA